MLVLKIKPCTSKDKYFLTVNLRMAHKISYNLLHCINYLDNRSNSRANTCINTQLLVGRVAFIRLKPMQSSGWYCVES